ncbi:MAG: extracellular solute-binding protein [Oscillospiraceae bacterium]|nr:extracellular solute-binding protein [Oscillospiraceae bacterium]
MQKFLRMTAILLCFLFLASCGPAEKPAVIDTSPESTNGDFPTEKAEDATDPEFPEVNMGQKQFNIFTSGWWGDGTMIYEVTDLVPAELLGEPVNDAAYNRRIKIEDTYNCKINQVIGSYDPSDDVTKLQRAVRSGDNTYDIAMMRGLNFQNLLTGNFLCDLDELDNIDFGNAWWNQKCSEALKIGNKRYGVSGYFSMLEINLASIIMFNKTLITDYALESPYELVKSGKWTFDKMISMAKNIARDLDGDGVMTEDVDLWGINYDRDRLWNLLNSCGIKILESGTDGYPQINIDAGENVAKIQKIFLDLFDESYSANNRRTGGSFSEGGVLFFFRFALAITQWRAEDVDFGIIPLPKYDEAQGDYMSNVYGFGLPIICVPTTNGDMENTGLFMEVFSYEGQKSLVPEYYENLLKTKSARDNESSEMLDYIFGNLYYDTGTLINISSFAQKLCEMCETLDTNVVSFVEKNLPPYEAALAKIIDEIKNG